MNNLSVSSCLCFLCLLCNCVAPAQGGESAQETAENPLYQANFETNAPGNVPEDLLVLEGGFVVREEGGNKFLELPGAPLDTFGVLFGPTGGTGLGVSARIQATGKGR